MKATEIDVDLALGLLDHQLVDCDGRRCGNVDDLEIDLTRDDPRVEAILAGPPVWRGRGILGRLLAALCGGRTVRIAWTEVVQVDSAVRLRKPAAEYGLGRGDDRLRPWIERIPGS